MQLKEVCEAIHKKFVKHEHTEHIHKQVMTYSDLFEKDFIDNGFGLMINNSEEIKSVHTSVFLSNKVLRSLPDNSLLIVHHPLDWDSSKDKAWKLTHRDVLETLPNRNISVMCMHVPLDDYGEFSTSKCLAKALNLKVDKPFGHYMGGLAGVLCKENTDIVSLKNKVASVVGHEVSLIQNGGNVVSKIAIIAGGGLDLDFLPDMVKLKADTLICGITKKNNWTHAPLLFAQENKLNIIGGTHYSTEKFAMIELCKFFHELGLPANFIPEEPCLADLDKRK